MTSTVTSKSETTEDDEYEPEYVPWDRPVSATTVVATNDVSKATNDVSKATNVVSKATNDVSKANNDVSKANNDVSKVAEVQKSRPDVPEKAFIHPDRLQFMRQRAIEPPMTTMTATRSHSIAIPPRPIPSLLDSEYLKPYNAVPLVSHSKVQQRIDDVRNSTKSDKYVKMVCPCGQHFEAPIRCDTCISDKPCQKRKPDYTAAAESGSTKARKFLSGWASIGK